MTQVNLTDNQTHSWYSAIISILDPLVKNKEIHKYLLIRGEKFDLKAYEDFKSEYGL